MPQDCRWCMTQYDSNQKEEDEIVWFLARQGGTRRRPGDKLLIPIIQSWISSGRLSCQENDVAKVQTFSRVATRRSDWLDRVGTLQGHPSDSDCISLYTRLPQLSWQFLRQNPDPSFGSIILIFGSIILIFLAGLVIVVLYFSVRNYKIRHPDL